MVEGATIGVHVCAVMTAEPVLAPGRAPPDHQPTTRGLDGGESDPPLAAIGITRADTLICGSRIRFGPPWSAFSDRAAGGLGVGLTGVVVGDACGLVAGGRAAGGQDGEVCGRVGERIVGVFVSDGPPTSVPNGPPNTTHPPSNASRTPATTTGRP
jgi:hypothetical protein